MLIKIREEVRDLELDERKEKILKAIIQTYLETGEPVGSRTISKYSDLKLSSATIRNEIWKSLVTSFSRIPRRDEFLPIKVTVSMLTRLSRKKIVRSSICRNL